MIYGEELTRWNVPEPEYYPGMTWEQKAKAREAQTNAYLKVIRNKYSGHQHVHFQLAAQSSMGIYEFIWDLKKVV